MPQYILIIIILLELAAVTTVEVVLFIKGNYNPYMFRNEGSGKRKLVNFFIIFSMYMLTSSIEPRILKYKVIAFVCLYGVAFSNILNYLSYRKVKDFKIIIQTIVFDVILVLILAILLFMTH